MLKQALSRPDQVTLTNLPQWSRVNNLDRARYPKPFMKDRLQPLPQTVLDGVGPEEGSCSEQSTMAETTPGIVDGIDLQRKVQQLENTVAFLRKQHRDVLEALHEEVDTLKRRNHGEYRNVVITLVLFYTVTGWGVNEILIILKC